MFRSLFPRKDRAATKPAPRKSKNPHTFRPHVEILEDRLAPALFKVIPIAAPADGVNTFHSLFAALHKTAAFAPGDVIQIEPGSNPGTVLNADLQVPAVAKITIQGDLAAAGSLANIPHFIVGDFYTGAPAEANWTFQNLNIDLADNTGGATATPAIELDGGGTVTGSTITIGKNANDGFFVDFFAGATANAVNTFTNNTIVLGTPTTFAATDLSLLEIDSGSSAGDKDIIAGNLFQANVAANFLIDYDGDGVAGQTELIASNTFIGSPGSNLTAMVNVGFGNGITGMTIQANTFTDSDSTAAGVIGLKLDESTALAASAQSATVAGNVFNLTGAKATDVSVLGGTAGKTSSTDVIVNNVFNAPSGTGLKITAGTTAGGAGTGDLVTVPAQGNSFNNDQFGVQVVVNAKTSPLNLKVDLGGGGASPGGNNFRGDPTGSAAGGAIVVSGVNPASLTTIQAQNDIFTGAAAAAVFNGGLASAGINVAPTLTGNAAFVETLYENLLHRFGDITNAADAGGFVNALNSGAMTQAAVAAAVAKSSESLGIFVNGLYQVLLGRQGDATGVAGFVGFLQNGGTLEQVVVFMVTSPEYASHVANDTVFVQSLYNKLLGRQGSAIEVQGWVETINTLGRAGIANAIVKSQELRTALVTGLYGTTTATASGPSLALANLIPGLLHRKAPPSASEVTAAVNSPLDTLTLTGLFLTSPEFFLDG